MRRPRQDRTRKDAKVTLAHKDGSNKKHKVNFYGLSTCGWCRKAREYLDTNDIDYNWVYVDQCQGEDRTATVARVRELNSRGSYPTMQIDGQVVVGYDEDRLNELLGL
jgi:glutaredoxin-like protein NrdH